jgi:hypothetical protein
LGTLVKGLPVTFLERSLETSSYLRGKSLRYEVAVEGRYLRINSLHRRGITAQSRLSQPKEPIRGLLKGRDNKQVGFLYARLG